VLVGHFMGQLNLGGPPLDAQSAIAGFIASFDAAGKHRWSKALGKSGKIYPRSVGVDNVGHIVIAGDFSESLDIGSTTLQSAGRSDLFVASFDATGAARWGMRVGGASWDTSAGLALSPTGDIFIGGDFSGEITLGAETLTSAGGTDGLLVRISNAGVPAWAHRYGGSSDDRVYDVAMAGKDALVVGGYFRESMLVGATTLTAKGNRDGFIAAVDTAGVATWGKSFGGKDGYAEVSGVAVDAAGRIAVIGAYSTAIELLGQSYSGGDSFEIFVTSLDADGAGRWGSVHGQGYPVDVAIDPAQQIVISGQLLPGGGDFGARLGTFGMADVFLAVLDATGSATWTGSFGSGQDDRGAGVAVDPQSGVIWQTGSFSADLTLGTTALTHVGGSDVFVARYSLE